LGERGVELCETLLNSSSNNSNLQLNQTDNFTIYDEFSLKSIYFKERENYEIWGLKSFSTKYIKSLLSKLDNLFKFTEGRNPKEILNTIKDKNLEEKYTRKAIRNLLNYLEINDLIEDSKLSLFRTKIKILTSTNIDTFVPSQDMILELENKLKNYNVLDYIVVKLLIDSGLRLTEIEYFINTFNINKVEVTEEVVVYPLMYLRGNKTSYYIFLNKMTYNLFLSRYIEFKTYKLERLKSYLKRNNLLSLKYIRKYNFTQMIKCGIDIEIANFIQGRASKNVGFNHYLAKKEIAVKEYKKLNIIFNF